MRELPTVELRHLRAFLAVAETGSFTRAAERLGVTQPSVSVRIRELEAALGTQLFHRLGQKTALSPEGRVFQPRAAMVMAKLSDACQSVQQGDDSAAGHVSVSIAPLLNVPLMPRTLGGLAAEHPGLTVTVIERSSDGVEHDVESGVADVGVGILSRSSPNLTYEALWEDELLLMQGADGPFAKKRSVSVEQVGEQRLVVLPESFVIRQLTDAAFRESRVLPRYAFEVDTVESVLATVVHTNLCTLMPRIVLRGREHLGVRVIAIKDWDRKHEFGLIWPGDGPSGAAARAFGERVRRIR